MRDLVWELHVANHFPSVWKPVNAFRLSKRVSGAPAANSLPPNCEAHFVTWSGRRRERSTPKTANNAASVRACNKRTEGTCLNFRARPLLTQKDGLYIPPPLPQPSSSTSSSSSSPPPSSSHPTTTNRGRERERKKKKLAHWELNCACTFLFGARRRYGKVVSLPPLPLPLPIPPSCSFSSSIMCLGYAHALHRAAEARLMQATECKRQF